MRNKLTRAVAALFALSFGACSQPSSTLPTDTVPVVHVKTDTVAIGLYGSIPYDTNTFYGQVQLGTVNDPAIPEASGLAASRAYPGMFWTHNDSGNPNTIFLLDSTGTKRAYFDVTGASNRDWEDIAVGPGPDPTKTYIYLGEIGDNNNKHQTSNIFRFPEPHDLLETSVYHGQTAPVEKITFFYPDGPHNAETLMIDPVTKDLYVVSKGGQANVYCAAYPQRTDTIFTMKEPATLPLATLTAGDISLDGTEILMKNYGIVYYWKRGAGESVVSALLRTPRQEPYVPEEQGEAVCWSVRGDAFYVTSEVANGIVPDFSVYRKK